jgi:hypothetical protein
MKASWNGSGVTVFVVSLCVSFALVLSNGSVLASEPDLPVKKPAGQDREFGVKTHFPFDLFKNIRGDDPEKRGLLIDLDNQRVWGDVFTGLYPLGGLEAYYDTARFRASDRDEDRIRNGKGRLVIKRLLKPTYNVNRLSGIWKCTDQGPWTMTPTIAYRLDVNQWKEKSDSGKLSDRINLENLGFYDGLVSFRKENGTFAKNLSIVEGPLATLITSDDPTSLVIAWQTDSQCKPTVYVWLADIRDGEVQMDNGHYLIQEAKRFSNTARNGSDRHEVPLSGLKPSTDYVYGVKCERTPDSGTSTECACSRLYHVRTAPRAGEGNVTFAYCGDSRGDYGGGERDLSGSNFRALTRIAGHAYGSGAEFLIFGGDLIDGYTTDEADFTMQLKSWKRAVAAFWRTRPVYPGMGNHEALVRNWDDGSRHGLCLDRWPYDTRSAEALFATEFFNPKNGPTPEDPRRPPYSETVYKFRYGPVLVIAFNNNYWYTSWQYKDGRMIPMTYVKKYGGSPEGYIMQDQLSWIIRAIQEGEKDPKVSHIVLFAQEPMFPCDGHIQDAMWYYGNNDVRAYSRVGDHVNREPKGVIEVRNELWKAMANSAKVAAFLTSDEHLYHRTLIGDTTPVGVVRKRQNAQGQTEEAVDKDAPNSDFTYPTWHIAVGTAGAPYYATLTSEVPWKGSIKKVLHDQGYALLRADRDTISLEFISIATGKVLDRVRDLKSFKKGAVR